MSEQRVLIPTLLRNQIAQVDSPAVYAASHVLMTSRVCYRPSDSLQRVHIRVDTSSITMATSTTRRNNV